MNQHSAKYIAEGFLEDAGRLMKDFLELKSVEFTNFASVWRKHHFSLIFMGRPDDTETSEFVNEIFRISTQYLFQETFYHHVGGAFLLYALYRNRISEPPVKIRLEKKHLEVVKSVRIEAFEKKYKTVLYVMDYLMNHAFLYLAKQTLRGPLIAGLPSAHDVSINKFKGIYRDSLMTYASSNNLAYMGDLHKKYLEQIELAGCARAQFVTDHEVYEKAIKKLDDFVFLETESEKNVGNKKANIKAQAFQNEAKTKFKVISSKIDALSKDCSSKETRIHISGLPVKEKREARPRKEDRRPGRPTKIPKPQTSTEENSDDDEIDFGYLLPQQKDLFMPPVYSEVKKCRTKRDPYYQLSPKRTGSESDLDTSGENDDPSNV